MPGLVGLTSNNTEKQDFIKYLDNMVNLMKHESYYVVDRKINGNIGLGSIDLNKGEFISNLIEDDRFILGFTGQVYDQEALHSRVSDNGTEPMDLLHLLLKIYRKFGAEGLCGLNGLYVAAVWNKKEKRLQIINDRYGFKKMYYWHGRDKFVFASEYKTICWFPDFPKKIDEFAFANLMSYGYVLEDRTLFEDIKLLPPASILTVQSNNLTINKYWDYSFYEEGDPRLSEDEYIDAFAEKLTRAVEKRVKGLDRLALSLSGGLDSRTMAAVLYRLNKSDCVKAFSFGPGHCYDVRFGKKIAQKLGFQFESTEIQPDFIQKHAREFQYLSEGMRSCDWAWQIHYQKRAFLKDNMHTVLGGFLGDAICAPRASWTRLINVHDDETAIDRAYKIHIDSFNEVEMARYLNPEIYKKVKNYNFEVLRETYLNAPTTNILNKARYANLHQRQRRSTYGFVDYSEFHVNRISPFIDSEFVDFLLHVPPELKVKQSLYKKMLIKHFPEVVKIGHSETGIPIKPSRWQEGMHWRKEQYKNLLSKIGITSRIDRVNYIEADEALRTGSRQFMLDVFSKSPILKDFFHENNFNNLVSDFLRNNSVGYEKICYPLSFLLWADIFVNEEKNGLCDSKSS